MKWRYAGASVLGTSHVGSSLPCQDAHACALYRDKAGKEILVLVASDGAGTAKRADEGAQLATASFQEAVKEYWAGRAESEFDEAAFRRLIGIARAALVTKSLQQGESLRAYACTFLVAVIGEEIAGYCQLGDGVMVVSEHGDGEDWSWVFWPQRGEFANATAFLTDDDALEQIEVEISCRHVEEIAVLTDGIERMVLKYDTHTVFSPFFETMFSPIRASSVVGPNAALSEALATYLNSPQVNQRTDDDKTLILATRRRGDDR
jgi:hypothetical protein